MFICLFRYPGELAWQLDLHRKLIRQNDSLKRLHQLLIQETESVSDFHPSSSFLNHRASGYINEWSSVWVPR